MSPSVRRSLFLLAVVPAVALAACSGGKGEKREGGPVANDPAMTGALGEQIMVDPDLTGQNEVAVGGTMAPGNRVLPSENNSPEEIAAARGEAAALMGGAGAASKLPAAEEATGNVPRAAAYTAAARAAAASPVGAKCADIVEYTTAWAAKLPKPFAVYPRGNVQEAAGTDKNGCALRVVNFTTPVSIEDVLTFYYTRGVTAGYSAARVAQGGDDILGGTKGQSSYMVYARSTPSGRTEVDLVTSN